MGIITHGRRETTSQNILGVCNVLASKRVGVAGETGEGQLVRGCAGVPVRR